nr:OstA-like protein [Mucilaginibacter straminoryzae]
MAAFSQRQPQKKSVVNLISSERSQGIKRNGVDVIKVYKGVFRQDYSTLRSDSAYFYPQNNAFDAFGNVNINQGDTLNIYSDKLNYNGNTHVALLTDNVKMVDRDAVLTTNYFTYNTATRIGTYTGGGKLVNKDNTLTSTNGYYFAFSRDAYFRYDVILNTVDAIIKTDTLRYNSGSRIAYFYGPTHIYGKKNKDTLYTENGTYNTITEQAFFGKKNLYTQSTKSLKGDSLFYDRLKGYGRAVKNVVFNDNEQKITLHGQIGTYFEKGERAVVTRNPWVTFITEEKDTTKTDSVKKKTLPVVKDAKAPPNTQPVKQKEVKDSKKEIKPATVTSVADTAKRVKQDTIYMVADTLETRMITYKEFKQIQEQRRLASIRDTAKIKKALDATPKSTSKFLIAIKPQFPKDTSYQHRNFFGPPKAPAKPPLTPVAKGAGGKKAPTDTLKNKTLKTDSVNLRQKFVLSDTTRIRILNGHYHAKLFKSDLQAKADSLFYSTSDSTIRCFVKPMLWSQGSQMSGDTLFLQMKNRKLDNMDVFPNSFIVNVEDNDTTHFNQVGGKKMKGFFVNNKLSRMFVDGNAESIYFQRENGKITNMARSLAARMRVNFKENKPLNIINISKPEHRIGPPEKFKDDEKLLKGFIWKPHDRPESKEQIIPELDKSGKYKRVTTPPVRPSKTSPGKPAVKGQPVGKPVTGSAKPDSTLNKTIKPAADSLKLKRDTTNKKAADN